MKSALRFVIVLTFGLCLTLVALIIMQQDVSGARSISKTAMRSHKDTLLAQTQNRIGEKDVSRQDDFPGLLQITNPVKPIWPQQLSLSDQPIQSQPSNNPLKEILNQLPLQFIPNQGQTDEAVRFLVKSLGGNLFFTRDEVIFILPNRDEKGGREKVIDKYTSQPMNTGVQSGKDQSIITNHNKSIVRLSFDGATPHPTLIGIDQQPGNVNFFLGNDPTKWQNGLPSYEAVAYRNLYPGIDLVYHGNQGKLKSEFIVAPQR